MRTGKSFIIMFVIYKFARIAYNKVQARDKLMFANLVQTGKTLKGTKITTTSF